MILRSLVLDSIDRRIFLELEIFGIGGVVLYMFADLLNGVCLLNWLFFWLVAYDSFWIFFERGLRTLVEVTIFVGFGLLMDMLNFEFRLRWLSCHSWVCCQRMMP